MLELDLNEIFNNSIVQSNWASNLIPHFVGIVIGHGNMISLKEMYSGDENSFACNVWPDYESDIEEFITHSNYFVEITPMINGADIPDMGCHAICGEGQMGNEGFVALVRNGILIWSFFSKISNPFYEIKRIGNSVFA